MPKRPIGYLASRLTIAASLVSLLRSCCPIAVSPTVPGQTQFTRMPCFAYSAAIWRVRLTIAPLAAQYAAMPGMPTSPATEPTLTMAPRAAAIISGSTARDINMVPVTLTAQTRCQLSGVLLCTLPKSAMPALLNRPSIVPSASRAAAAARSTLAASVTSQATPNA